MSMLNRGRSPDPLAPSQVPDLGGKHPYLDFRNLGGLQNGFINGDLEYWQRKTSATAFDEYIADRWIGYSTHASQGHSQQVIAPGTASTKSRYSWRMTATSQIDAVNGYCAVTQRIEDVRSYAGKRVRVSVKMRKISGAGDIVVSATQFFGSGGSPSAVVSGILPVPGQRRMTPDTTWQRFSVVMDIPAITGKILGTAGDDFLQIYFWSGTGTARAAQSDNLGRQDLAVEMTDFVIHEVIPGYGDPIIDFELFRRHTGTELALCQRYFEKSYDVDTPPGTATPNGKEHMDFPVASAGALGWPVKFRVLKRAPPAISGYSDATGAINKVNRGGTDLPADHRYPGQTGFQFINFTTPTSAAYMAGHWVANAEL